MNVKAAIARATDICERIAAPDFAPRGRLVRLVPWSAVRKLSPRLACGLCGGWTNPLLDVLLSDHLQLPTGTRAFVAIVRDDVNNNEAAIVNVALHELSHDLESLNIPAAVEPVEALGALGQVSLASLPTSWASDYQPSAERIDHEHGERFTRATIHVAYRARQLGWPTAAELLHLCRPRLVQSLGDEPRQREAEPISSILETPAPAAFARLWSAAA